MEPDTSMAETVRTPHNGNGVEVAEGSNAAPGTADGRDRDAPLIMRLWRAGNEIGKLEKDAEHEIRKDGKKVGAFNYITHDQVVQHVKVAFKKHGIAVLPTVEECKQDGNRTVMKVLVTLMNVDKPEDHLQTVSIGYGVDSSDKGPGKAYSYAMKYAYMKLLMLNSADDIEQDGTDYQPALPPEHAATAMLQNKQALKSWAASFKSALTNAGSIREIDDLQKENKDTLMSSATPDVTREFFVDLIEQRKAELSE